jgi:hypothetical protein
MSLRRNVFSWLVGWRTGWLAPSHACIVMVGVSRGPHSNLHPETLRFPRYLLIPSKTPSPAVVSQAIPVSYLTPLRPLYSSHPYPTCT